MSSTGWAKRLLRYVYRYSRWTYLNVRSLGKINRVIVIDPQSVSFGQTPESQFPPRRFLGGIVSGDWDQHVIPVEEHLLYKSYVQHFLEGDSWTQTPFFQFAHDSIKEGRAFRGEYDSVELLNERFHKCDELYKIIKKDGYKSNRQLFKEGKIDNILDLLDEITVNISRDGSIILNDGWHRFATARLLRVPEITVRVCAIHPDYEVHE